MMNTGFNTTSIPIFRLYVSVPDPASIYQLNVKTVPALPRLVQMHD